MFKLWFCVFDFCADLQFKMKCTRLQGSLSNLPCFFAGTELFTNIRCEIIAPASSQHQSVCQSGPQTEGESLNWVLQSLGLTKTQLDVWVTASDLNTAKCFSDCDSDLNTELSDYVWVTVTDLNTAACLSGCNSDLKAKLSDYVWVTATDLNTAICLSGWDSDLNTEFSDCLSDCDWPEHAGCVSGWDLLEHRCLSDRDLLEHRCLSNWVLTWTQLDVWISEHLDTYVWVIETDLNTAKSLED